jgi:hypothetical protein
MNNSLTYNLWNIMSYLIISFKEYINLYINILP